jgi:hypothetical protein
VDARGFRRRPNVEKLLASMLVAGRLSLFLGAGVSVPIGLPSWPALIKRMYRLGKKQLPKGVDLLKLADEIMHTACDSDSKKFAALVSSSLYQGKKARDFDFVKLRENATLSALAAMVMSSKRGRVSDVFTFNFDDLLERYLEYHGFVVEPVPICDERFWAPSCDVAIYHAHGFLPSPGSSFTTASNKLILGANSYAECTGDINLRSNQRMLVALEGTMALFIGLSGDDLRLQSLLQVSKVNHAYNPVELGYRGVALHVNPSASTRAQWKNYGIWAQDLRDFKTDLPRFLLRVCQLAGISLRSGHGRTRPSPLEH